MVLIIFRISKFFSSAVKNYLNKRYSCNEHICLLLLGQFLSLWELRRETQVSQWRENMWNHCVLIFSFALPLSCSAISLNKPRPTFSQTLPPQQKSSSHIKHQSTQSYPGRNQTLWPNNTIKQSSLKWSQVLSCWCLSLFWRQRK